MQKIIDSFQRRWTRDVFSLLVPRRKWNSEKRKVQVDDIVIVQDGTAIRGKWKLGRVIDLYPRNDGKVRNANKTASGEYSRPLKKVAVIHPGMVR